MLFRFSDRDDSDVLPMKLFHLSLIMKFWPPNMLSVSTFYILDILGSLLSIIFFLMEHIIMFRLLYINSIQ